LLINNIVSCSISPFHGYIYPASPCCPGFPRVVSTPPKNHQVINHQSIHHILKRRNGLTFLAWVNHRFSDSNPPCSPGIRRDSTGTSCPRTFRRWREGWRRRLVDPLGRSTNTSGISRRSTRS
jgi:hypothetical protein